MKSRRKPAIPASDGPPLRTLDRRPPAVSGGEDPQSPWSEGKASGGERILLETSHGRLRRLVRRYYDGAIVDAPGSRHTGEAKSAPDGYRDDLTIRLRLVEDERSPLPEGCTELWSGGPQRFTVRLGSSSRPSSTLPAP